MKDMEPFEVIWCEYSDCQREAESFESGYYLCLKHARLAERCMAMQAGGILGAAAGFLGLGA